MQIGIDSFAAAISDPATGLTLSPVERMHHLLEEIELADRVGLDVFGIGEHHRAEFLDSAPVVILSAAATRTENIQEFATLDFISRGRAEIVAGRGSFVESYPLFGLRLEDYDSLFAEKRGGAPRRSCSRVTHRRASFRRLPRGHHRRSRRNILSRLCAHFYRNRQGTRLATRHPRPV